MVEKIRDSAGQKGTGKWTAISALDYGIPVTLIGESVFARCLSALKDERVFASKELPGPGKIQFDGDVKEFVQHISKVSVCFGNDGDNSCTDRHDARRFYIGLFVDVLGFICFEDRVLCTRIHAVARSSQSLWVES